MDLPDSLNDGEHVAHLVLERNKQLQSIYDSQLDQRKLYLGFAFHRLS